MLSRSSLHDIPDETANRMSMRHGSEALARALRGEPEPVVVESSLPKLKHRRRPYVRVVERPRKSLTPAAREIVERVAEAFEVSPQEVLGRDRQRRLWIARTVAIRLTRDLDRFGDYSTTQIGAMFDNRDHSTICNALQAFETWAAVYPEVAEIYRTLSERRAA